MKRGNSRLFFVLLLAIIISLSFISASWLGDFFKITGGVLNSSEVLIEEDIGNLSFVDSDVLERNCELMEAEIGNDSHECDTYSAMYNHSADETGILEVLIEVRDDAIINKAGTAAAIANYIANLEGMTLEYESVSDDFAIYTLTGISGNLALWIDENNVIAVSGQWNKSIIGNEEFFEPAFLAYLEKYPSDLIYNETVNRDLTVGETIYDDTNLLVGYCNSGTVDAAGFSIRLDKDNETHSTGNVLSIGVGCSNVPMSRMGLNFEEGDIFTITVDSDNTITESNEENNELTVQCLNGTCLPYILPYCEDSDFGADLYTKGIVTMINSLGTVSKEDVCMEINGVSMVVEYYCTGNGSDDSSSNYECLWGCQDGACLPRNPIVDFGDKKGYAVDYQTNLFWQRQSSSDKTWNDARNYCEALNLGGYIDWRLPTLEELKVLYPVSVGEGISGFLGDSEVVGAPGMEINGSVPEGNVVTGVGMRATGGDVNRVRLQIRPLQGCTLGTATQSLFGSGLEGFERALPGYVVTGVGAGCGDDCDITHLSITTRKLNFPCRLGNAMNGSGNPERMQFASEGYVVTGVSARAKPGDIRGLTLEYQPIGLIPTDKFLDIQLGENYWTIDREEGNASILKWVAGASVPETGVAALASRNSLVCVRDGRITPEQLTDTGSCQLCRQWRSESVSIFDYFGRLLGLTEPTTTKWDCVGFDDTPLLTDFTSDIDNNDFLDLKIGCGDRRLTESCSLSVRYADNNGRANADLVSANFNGIELTTDFEGNVDSNDDFDLSADCENDVIRESCQLCRRFADNNGRANADWECVNFDGTALATDFVGDVNKDDDFDLKVRCDVEPVPNCIDSDISDIHTKGSCTNMLGDVSIDYCNGTTLTEFSCGDGFECVSSQHNCPYGCLDGACLSREETNDAYFVLSKQGNFDILLTDMIGANHEISDVNFRNTRFKMLVDLRLLSAITPTSGYTDEMISSAYDVDNFAQINSIQRHNYESYTDVDKVPETVFGANRFDIDNLENLSSALDLTDETANETYIFKEEQVDKFHGPGVIHSSRDTTRPDVLTTPTFSGGVYGNDGVTETYGNGAYVYIDFFGRLHFRYETQNQNSRAVFSVGILACECSLGEERCDGSNYLSCDDGCSMINNGEVVGECGVIQPCVDSDNGKNNFNAGTTLGVEWAGTDVVNSSDICDETTLTEYFCQDNYVASESVECALGCVNGACIDCIDSDSGKDYSTAGNVLGRDISGELFSNDSDRCLGDTLVERICTNGYADSAFFDCPHGCKNGFCEGVECRVEFGDNTSACGTSNYNVDGTLFCTVGNEGKYEYELYNVSDCELGCSAGICEVPTCVDYDLGDAENVTKSNATSSLGDFLVDTCSDTDTLQEAVCVNGEATADSRTCEFGCSNGRCLGESSCNDTDIGLNYFVSGISVSCVGTECIVGENESCVDGNNLWESYCGRNDEIIWQQFLCPEGCVNGACNIPEERPNATCPSVTVAGPEIKPGIRLVVQGQLSYCDPFTLTYQPVKASGDSCMNDFECSNNACVEGECYSVRTELATQREILEEQTGLLQEIRCWLRSLIGVQDYDECLNESLGG